jgi:hypothetical protein
MVRERLREREGGNGRPVCEPRGEEGTQERVQDKKYESIPVVYCTGLTGTIDLLSKNTKAFTSITNEVLHVRTNPIRRSQTA